MMATHTNTEYEPDDDLLEEWPAASAYRPKSVVRMTARVTLVGRGPYPGGRPLPAEENLPPDAELV